MYASCEPSARTAIAEALHALVEVSFMDSAATEATAQSLAMANLIICDTTLPLPLPIPGAALALLPRIAVTQLHGPAAREQMFGALLGGVDHVCSRADVGDFRTAVAMVLAANVGDFGLGRFRTDDQVVIFRRTIADAAARHALVQELVGFCQVRGCAGAALSRVQSVVDELLMNAQLDAPRGADREAVTAPQLEWMWQDNRLLLAVTDWFGRFEKQAAITAIARAREAAGAPNPASAVGAGVGLFLVMAHVERFIVQVQPQQRTEVVCVLDVVADRGRLRTAQQHSGDGVRAIHVMVLPPTVGTAPGPAPALPG